MIICLYCSRARSIGPVHVFLNVALPGPGVILFIFQFYLIACHFFFFSITCYSLFVHGILVRGRRQSMLFRILSSRVAFTYVHHYSPRLLLLRLIFLWSRTTSGHLGCCTIPNLASASLLSSHSYRLTQKNADN